MNWKIRKAIFFLGSLRQSTRFLLQRGDTKKTRKRKAHVRCTIVGKKEKEEEERWPRVTREGMLVGWGDLRHGRERERILTARRVKLEDRDRPRCWRDSTIKLVSPPTRFLPCPFHPSTPRPLSFTLFLRNPFPTACLFPFNVVPT